MIIEKIRIEQNVTIVEPKIVVLTAYASKALRS